MVSRRHGVAYCPQTSSFSSAPDKCILIIPDKLPNLPSRPLHHRLQDRPAHTDQDDSNAQCCHVWLMPARFTAGGFGPFNATRISSKVILTLSFFLHVACFKLQRADGHCLWFTVPRPLHPLTPLPATVNTRHHCSPRTCCCCLINCNIVTAHGNAPLTR